MTKFVSVLVLLSSVTFLEVQGHPFDSDMQVSENFSFIKSRSKRSVFNLCRVMECTTNRNCRDYNKYGCWCGLQSSGRIMDGIDRCCYYHDQCADAAMAAGCKYYAQGYRHSCWSGKPSCHGGNSCKMRICNCDVQFAHCIARQPYYGKKSCSSRG